MKLVKSDLAVINKFEDHVVNEQDPDKEWQVCVIF